MAKQASNKPNPIAIALNKGKADLFPDPSVKEKEKSPNKESKTQANREGKKTVIAYLDSAAAKEFKMLALKHGITQQELLIEAINDVLIKYGQQGIA